MNLCAAHSQWYIGECSHCHSVGGNMSEWITPDEVKEHHDNGYEAGVAHERERIIALLETLKGPDKACCDDCQPHADKNRHYLTSVIALIKGQNE